MSCVTREVLLPLDADEAWETVTELEEWLVDDADLILVMDEANLADARRLATTDEQRDRIHLMGEFASDADRAGVREVPDPYGYPRPQFEEMYRQIEDAADGVVAAIRDGRL